MIVLDASLVAEIVLGTQTGLAAVSRLRQADAALGAPELVDLEVVQVLRRLLFRGEVSRDHAEQAISLLSDLPVERYGHGPLRPRVWELRDNATAYDAAYIALAERCAAPLWTCDRKLSSVPWAAVEVEVVT